MLPRDMEKFSVSARIHPMFIVALLRKQKNLRHKSFLFHFQIHFLYVTTLKVSLTDFMHMHKTSLNHPQVCALCCILI